MPFQPGNLIALAGMLPAPTEACCWHKQSATVCQSVLKSVTVCHAGTQGEKYGYTAKLASLQLPSGCSADSIRISKLYVQVGINASACSGSSSGRRCMRMSSFHGTFKARLAGTLQCRK